MHMQGAIGGSQALAPADGCESRRVADQFLGERERLALLEPGVCMTSTPNLQAYALAYVERYEHDILQLEHEREFLCAALTQARQEGNGATVISLVGALAPLLGRFNNPNEARRIVLLGIEASRVLHDKQHLACFLNRLGGLLYAQGDYEQGRRVWHASQQCAGTSDALQFIWEPLASFVHITDILGSYAAARQFVASCHMDDADTAAVTIFTRGFYARVMNDLDTAYGDLSCCLRLLTLQASDGPPSPARQLFSMVVQAELARVQGQYTRSQAYTETALSLAHLYGDRYTVATLLMDQGLYTLRQGQLADTHATFVRLRSIARQLQIPHAHRCCRMLEQSLPASLLEGHKGVAPRQGGLILSSLAPVLCQPLSEREREVLQLAARGLSNREIAMRLVITTATVKKHLEHIYTRLDVHNRTSAIAQARSLQMIS